MPLNEHVKPRWNNEVPPKLLIQSRINIQMHIMLDIVRVFTIVMLGFVGVSMLEAYGFT